MRNWLIIGGVLAVTLIAGAHAQEAGSVEAADSSEAYAISDEEFKVPISAELAAEVDELIVQLGSPEYALREEATTRLTEIGVPGFAKLRDAFRSSDDLEARLRIERVVRTAFFAAHVYGRNAFLGIQQDAIAVGHADDPRILEGHLGIRVNQVIEDTAAEEAGVANNDVIIALDGKPLSARTAQPTAEFGESIRLRGPGTLVTLSVLRGDKELEITALLRPRPRRYYDRQNIVTDMLAEAKQRFPIWWHMHFRGHDAAKPDTNGP